MKKKAAASDKRLSAKSYRKKDFNRFSGLTRGKALARDIITMPPSPPRTDISKEAETKDDLVRSLTKLPVIRQIIEEEAIAQRYVLARYRTLINRKYLADLSSQETEELNGLEVTLDDMEEPFYDSIIQRLRTLVERSIVR